MSITSIAAGDVAKITSGQVIVDLVSVVKELVENSLDAGSDKIDVTFRLHGVAGIEVTDTGVGIGPDDYQLVCLKHHTSKLESFDDLATVATLGFRGEAMSSLCTLAKVKITTCTKATFPKAVELHFDTTGHTTGQKSVVSGRKGTTVSVNDLFSGLPVRQKNFVKHSRREYTKALTMVMAYMLAYPGVRFTVYNVSGNTGKKTLAMGTPGGHASTTDALVSVFGTNGSYGLVPVDIGASNLDTRFRVNMHSVDMHLLVRLHGYISDSSFGLGRGSSDRQFLTVNKRPVSHKRLEKTINEVYRTFNSTQYPVFVVDLELDTTFVDVNVTPDKRMVLVQSEDLVVEVVREELTAFYEGRNNVVPKNVLSSQKLGQVEPNHKPPKSEGSRSGETDDSQAHSRGRMQLEFVNEGPETDESEDDNANENAEETGAHGKRGVISGDEISTKITPGHCRLSRATKSDGNDGNFVEIGVIDSIIDTIGDGVEPHVNNGTAPDSADKDDQNEPRVVEVVDPVVCEGERDSSTEPPQSQMWDMSKSILNFTGTKGLDAEAAMHNHGNLQRIRSHPQGPEETSQTTGGAVSVGRAPTSPQVHCSTQASIDAEEKIDMFEDLQDVQMEDLFVGEETTIITNASEGVQAQHGSDCARENHPIDRLMQRPPISGTRTDPHADDRPKHHSDSGPQHVHNVRIKLGSPYDLKARVEFNAASKSGKSATGAGVLAAIHDFTEALEICKQDFGRMEVVGQFNLGFIIVTHESKLFIVDQHALDEIYNYELLMKSLILRAQPLVVPRRLELSAVDEMIILEHLPELKKNGFIVEDDIDATPGQRVKLVAVPVLKNVVFDDSDLHELVHKLHHHGGSQRHTHGSVPHIRLAVRCQKVDTMIALRACRLSIMVGQALNKSKMKVIVQHLSELDRPWNCPHGRPTMRHLADLEAASFGDDYSL